MIRAAAFEYAFRFAKRLNDAIEIVRGRPRRRRVEELRALLAEATPGGRQHVLEAARSIGGDHLAEVEEALAKLAQTER